MFSPSAAAVLGKAGMSHGEAKTGAEAGPLVLDYTQGQMPPYNSVIILCLDSL